MANKSIFITATGTDVGKTYVSALLVKKMRDFGLNCGYYKPALSGAQKQPDGSLLLGDCDFVIKTSGLCVKSQDCATYYFEEAVSPHLAAKRQGVVIDSEIIKSEFKKRLELYDYLVVEGAGGITCPFNLESDNKLLLNDVIKNLGTKVIIVADGGLGTINSVLLTVEYAKNHGIYVAGLILNNFNEDDFMHIDNKIQIEKLTGIKVIAVVKKNEKELKISKEDLLSVFS